MTFQFKVDGKSHKGVDRLFKELAKAAGSPAVRGTFGWRGKDYEIVNAYGNQHRKIVRVEREDHPLLKWAKENKKRISHAD